MQDFKKFRSLKKVSEKSLTKMSNPNPEEDDGTCSEDNPCCVQLDVGVKILAVSNIIIELLTSVTHLLSLVACFRYRGKHADGAAILGLLLGIFLILSVGGIILSIILLVGAANKDASQVSLFFIGTFILEILWLLRFLVDLGFGLYEGILVLGFIVIAIGIVFRVYLLYTVHVFGRQLRRVGNGGQAVMVWGQIAGEGVATFPPPPPQPQVHVLPSSYRYQFQDARAPAQAGPSPVRVQTQLPAQGARVSDPKPIPTEDRQTLDPKPIHIEEPHLNSDPPTEDHRNSRPSDPSPVHAEEHRSSDPNPTHIEDHRNSRSSDPNPVHTEDRQRNSAFPAPTPEDHTKSRSSDPHPIHTDDHGHSPRSSDPNPIHTEEHHPSSSSDPPNPVHSEDPHRHYDPTPTHTENSHSSDPNPNPLGPDGQEESHGEPSQSRSSDPNPHPEDPKGQDFKKWSFGNDGRRNSNS